MEHSDKQEISALKEAMAILQDANSFLHAELNKIKAGFERVEQFIPILGEHFAGKLAGTSEESQAVIDALKGSDPEQLKAALAANSTAAKSTENPVTHNQNEQ